MLTLFQNARFGRSIVSIFLVAGTLIFAAAGLSGCENDESSQGTVAPAFELKDASGTVHRLEDFRGSVVLLHFWASWCPPCLEEIPRWLAAAPQFKDMPVKMIAVSVDEQWAEALKILPIADVPPNMISLLDPDSKVARSFGTSRFPESYILDPDLKIVEKWQGIMDWKSPRVRFAVNKAVVKARKVSGGGGFPQTPAPAPSAR